jgi:sugar phosphate isomerase/epimerase
VTVSGTVYLLGSTSYVWPAGLLSNVRRLGPWVDDVESGLCVDVGHLWLTGRDPLAFLAAHLDRTRAIHQHGTGERDHQSLLLQGHGPVAAILALLADRHYDGVLTLEVFGWEDFFSSRELVCEVLNGTH